MSTDSKKHKGRSDKALTQNVASAMVQRVKSGLPLISRDREHLLIDYKDGQKPISKWTYNSWMKRGTIPLNSKNNRPIRDILNEERQNYKEKEKDRLLDTTYTAIERILLINPIQNKVIECTNEHTGLKEKVAIKEIDAEILKQQVRASKMILDRVWVS